MSESPAPLTASQRFRQTLLWFVLFLGLYYVLLGFFAPPAAPVLDGTVSLTAEESYTQGHIITAELSNATEGEITFTPRCEPSTFTVQRLGTTATTSPLSAEQCAQLPAPVTLAAGESAPISFPLSNLTLFPMTGEYQLSLSLDDGTTIDSRQFTVESAGWFRSAFRTIVSRPLFNALTWLSVNLPEASLGLAIIALTLLVRLLLFWPNQRALASQSRLQALQPQIEKLKKKHGDNKQALALATMQLYSEHGVNPMSSCLPLLLQMPFLLGIYYIVQDGLAPHLRFLLYPFQTAVDLSAVSPAFLGLDLTATNFFPLPIIVAGAQFVAMKLMMPPRPAQPAKADNNDMAAQMQQMQGMMVYVMPLMIGFFTATLPAGVGIYWVTSTLFGIAQHWFIKRQLATEKVLTKRS